MSPTTPIRMLAQKTRHKFYDMAGGREKATVVGFHFTVPGRSVHVEKDGTGYRLVPVAFNPVL